MYVTQPQHNRVVNVVNIVWLGDDDEVTTTTPNGGDSCAGVHAHERNAFVDHPPPPQRLRRDEPEIDVLDPAFISAARWKKKHIVH